MLSHSIELQKDLLLTASSCALNDQIGIGAAPVPAKLIAFICEQLSSESAPAFYFLRASHGTLQTNHFKHFHGLLRPLHGLTDEQPQAKYARGSPTTLQLKIANEFVFRCEKLMSRDSRQRSIASTHAASAGSHSRRMCDAQAVRAETPLRDTLQQQPSFKFGSATHDASHRAVSHARRQSWRCSETNL
jgi:hypothetical protein